MYYYLNHHYPITTTSSTTTTSTTTSRKISALRKMKCWFHEPFLLHVTTAADLHENCVPATFHAGPRILSHNCPMLLLLLLLLLLLMLLVRLLLRLLCYACYCYFYKRTLLLYHNTSSQLDEKSFQTTLCSVLVLKTFKSQV